jgi:hypothetical protein
MVCHGHVCKISIILCSIAYVSKPFFSLIDTTKIGVYDNEYSLIIDLYFDETFFTQTSSACALYNLLDTLSNILDKCLRFSLIKIESVSIYPSQAMLGSLLLFVVNTFLLKMQVLVLIKNCNSFVHLI